MIDIVSKIRSKVQIKIAFVDGVYKVIQPEGLGWLDVPSVKTFYQHYYDGDVIRPDEVITHLTIQDSLVTVYVSSFEGYYRYGGINQEKTRVLTTTIDENTGNN